MLFRSAINQELQSKGEAFKVFMREYSANIDEYLKALEKLEEASEAGLSQATSIESVGAVPSDELQRYGSFSVGFGIEWENHEQARRWAEEVLEQRTTFAADGSQIYAGKETSFPVAAVQIGWFENPHDSERPYEKNAKLEVLTPDDLLADLEEPMNPDIRVEARRYLGEVARVKEFIHSCKDWEIQGKRMPVAFFDNPLLVPFSQKGLQRSFLEATVDLVEASNENRVPVVGFVDRSFSRDVLSLLHAFGAGVDPKATSIYDASLLRTRRENGNRTLESWGDRTTFCFSKRRGLEAFINGDGRSTVGFVYLQTTAEGMPARIDLPAWLMDAGRIDEVVDVVRAECVVGLGYPYVLEAADQTAVIAARDREIFFRALQEFALREKLEFSVTRKDISKSRRR